MHALRAWLSGRPALAGVLVLGLALRLGVMARGPGRFEDPDNYLPLARSLASGRGYSYHDKPTAYRPPLYPIVLAPLVAVLGDRLAWGVAGLHLALGAGTILLTAGAASRWGLSPTRTLAAAAVVAVDPVLVAQGRSVMTETLGAFLVALTLRLMTVPGVRGGALGGLGFGLSALCRPSLLPAAGLLAGLEVLGGAGSLRDRLRRAGVLVLATAATLAPWAVRNWWRLGEPVWTTTHGGYTLALANNVVYYREVLDGPPGAVWSGPNQARWWRDLHAELAGLSEPEADRRCRALALRLLAERPRNFARAALARLGRFWGLAPSGAVYPRPLRWATAAWTLPLWIALGWGLVHRSAWLGPRATAAAVVASLSLVHLFFWTDLRMRAPLVPAIALIAASCPPPPAWLARLGRWRKRT